MRETYQQRLKKLEKDRVKKVLELTKFSKEYLKERESAFRAVVRGEGEFYRSGMDPEEENEAYRDYYWELARMHDEALRILEDNDYDDTLI